MQEYFGNIFKILVATIHPNIGSLQIVFLFMMITAIIMNIFVYSVQQNVSNLFPRAFVPWRLNNIRLLQQINPMGSMVFAAFLSYLPEKQTQSQLYSTTYVFIFKNHNYGKSDSFHLSGTSGRTGPVVIANVHSVEVSSSNNLQNAHCKLFSFAVVFSGGYKFFARRFFSSKNNTSPSLFFSRLINSKNSNVPRGSKKPSNFLTLPIYTRFLLNAIQIFLINPQIFDLIPCNGLKQSTIKKHPL